MTARRPVRLLHHDITCCTEYNGHVGRLNDWLSFSHTLDKLEAAFEAVEKDLSGRVAELAGKNTAGMLSQEEQAEYEQLGRLNDWLSILKLQAEEYWAPRVAS